MKRTKQKRKPVPTLADAVTAIAKTGAVTEQAKIERSNGIVPRFADGAAMPTGILPGGGYSGATLELDNAVTLAAKKLQGATGHNIEIRFNSHRKSGGAYLKGVEPTLGIGAAVHDGDDKIHFDVYCGLKHLKTAAFANNHGTGEPYFFDRFDSLDFALDWIVIHTNIPTT